MTSTKYVQVPVEVVQRLRDIEGCFEAARVEGLEQALAETTDERLKDLIVRRLSWASTYANDALHLIAAAPQQAQAGEAEWLQEWIEKEFGFAVHIDGVRKLLAALQPQAVDEREDCFNQAGTFAALYAAQDWCRTNGISYGSSQAGAPTGLMRGNFAIAKWRNLSNAERAELDGTMTGNMRDGPVTIELKDSHE